MLKKVISFLFLKLFEILSVVFLPLIAGNFLKKMPLFKETGPAWFIGIIGIGMTIIIAVIVAIVLFAITMIILRWVNWNWKLVNNNNGIEWVENLLDKLNNLFW